ncbi:RHS repeat-associated core domain-containing protein [Zooshikella harenae]|uniref:RHS domain-containing protein n=1 Tax=Zooshikella harenae TaxID=2827238 RepID=A0ABS5ZBC6_9GAMM|nr:RHS repeat-associated core domain-containing protein [Zooshikella harenae]MBU2711368.1 RHS domain-containing protein [Zooshikella harenae]
MKTFFQSLSMFNFALKQKQLTYGLIVWLLTLMIMQPVQAAEIITYYHNDLTGTPVAASDESGNLLWREEYTPYGEQLTQDKKSASNRRGFTGHVQDRDLGLVYMQARYYDPVLGRFLAYDPAGVNPESPFTFNRYAYGNNNPYGYADPDGELAFLIPAVIWGVGAAMTAYDTYQTYQNEGAAAAAQSLVIDGAITVVSGGVGKIATKTGRGIFKWIRRSPCGCFAAGTLVKTKEGLKPIEEVKLGDLLAAKNEETGEIAWKPVIKQHIYENRPLNTLVLQTKAQNSVELTVTDDHPFWVKGKGWVKSVNLNVGDEVANYETGWHKVVSWTSLETVGTTYNFDVKDYESYFVSEQLVWVHNGGPCDDVITGAQKRLAAYLKHSGNWSSGSLKGTLDKYAKGIKGELSHDGVKTNYINEKLGIKVMRDNENNYFRIYDMNRKTYLDASGNIPKTGALRGKEAKNFLQEQTHIRNAD